MDDLYVRLQKALDEAEQRGRALLVSAQRTSLMLKEPRLLGREIPGWHAWPDVEAMCGRELGLIERDRKLLAWHDQSASVHCSCSLPLYPCRELVAAAEFWLTDTETTDG